MIFGPKCSSNGILTLFRVFCLFFHLQFPFSITIHYTYVYYIARTHKKLDKLFKKSALHSLHWLTQMIRPAHTVHRPPAQPVSIFEWHRINDNVAPSTAIIVMIEMNSMQVVLDPVTPCCLLLKFWYRTNNRAHENNWTEQTWNIVCLCLCVCMSMSIQIQWMHWMRRKARIKLLRLNSVAHSTHSFFIFCRFPFHSCTNCGMQRVSNGWIVESQQWCGNRTCLLMCIWY